MARKLTEREMNQLERWGKKGDKSRALDLIATLPPKVVLPRPVLLGSINGQSRFVEGYASTYSLTKQYFYLDDTFQSIPYAPRRTLVMRKRLDVDGSTRLKRAMRVGLGIRLPKVCLAEHMGNCGTVISSAHTVQRSELKKYATPDNHVYGVIPGGAVDKRNFSIPEKIGVNTATTFAGVCNRHDTEIFQPIETIPFSGSEWQMFLFHYRSILFEFYRRKFLYQKLQHICDDVTGSNVSHEMNEIRAHLANNEQDLKEVHALRSRSELALRNSNCQEYSLHSWIADKAPPLVGTFTFAPHKDLLGREIQKPGKGATLEWISLTLTVKDQRTILVVGSEKLSVSGKLFVESIEECPSLERMQNLIVFCLCFMENAIFLPHWWEHLSEEQQEAAIRVRAARVFPRKVSLFGEWTLIRC